MASTLAPTDGLTPSTCPCGKPGCTSTVPLLNWHTNAEVTKDGTVIPNNEPFFLHPEITEILSGLPMIPATLDNAAVGNTGYIDCAQPTHLRSPTSDAAIKDKNGVFFGRDGWNRSFAALLFTDTVADPTERHVVVIFQRDADNKRQFMWATKHHHFSAECCCGQSIVDSEKPLAILRLLVAGTHPRFSLCL